MYVQKKALQIIYDITGTILRWDKQQLSDRDAMREIVRTLASKGDNLEEKEEVVLIENIEVNNEQTDRKKFNELKKVKITSVLSQRRVLAPLTVAAVVFAVLFAANPFVIDEQIIATEDAEIKFQQQNEIPSEINKIEENSVIENFDNKTISKQD